MKHASRLVCLVAVALLLASLPVLADGWTTLGERALNFKGKPVNIEPGAAVGPVSKLRLEATKNVFQVLSVKVTFADGQTFGLALNEFLMEGNGRIIDLPGAKQVKAVEVSVRKCAATDHEVRATLAVSGLL